MCKIEGGRGRRAQAHTETAAAAAAEAMHVEGTGPRWGTGGVWEDGGLFARGCVRACEGSGGNGGDVKETGEREGREKREREREREREMAYRVSLPLQHRARGGVVRHCGRRRGGRVRGRRVGGVGGRLRALWVHSLGGHCRGRRSRRVPCTWAACELGRPVPVARCRETAMAAAWACRWPRWHVGAQKRGLLGRPSLGWVTVVRAWGGPVPRRRRARVVPRLAWRGISPQGWSLRTRLWCGAAGRACCGAGASQRVGRPASARMAGTGTGTGAGVGARAQW